MSRLACVFGAAIVFAPSALGVTFIHVIRTTASYTLVLTVGPKEAMYTAAQVKAKHPKSGEVMIGDAMGMGGMAMDGANRHLEVHVVSRKTGKVVTDARPTIVLTDRGATAMPMSEKVNATAMEGIGEGVADLHYGGNVELTRGHVYRVVVTVAGEKAVFTFKA